MLIFQGLWYNPPSMLPDFNENQINRNPGIPDQESNRTSIVINELSRLVRRLLSDPRSSLQSRPEQSCPDKPLFRIEYRSVDDTIAVSLRKEFFSWPRFTSDVPGDIQRLGKGHERIIPMNISKWNGVDVGHPEIDQVVWIDLDKDDPAIFQLVDENGALIGAADMEVWGEWGEGDDFLTGKYIVDRPDYWEHVWRAVSGVKAEYEDDYIKDGIIYSGPDPEWRDTFGPNDAE